MLISGYLFIARDTILYLDSELFVSLLPMVIWDTLHAKSDRTRTNVQNPC